MGHATQTGIFTTPVFEANCMALDAAERLFEACKLLNIGPANPPITNKSIVTLRNQFAHLDWYKNGVVVKRLSQNIDSSLDASFVLNASLL